MSSKYILSDSPCTTSNAKLNYQALLNSQAAAEEWIKAVFQSTSGIIFIGTPHHGSDKAKWVSVLTRISNSLRHTNHPIVDVLSSGSEVLANLQQSFFIMLDDQARNHKKDLKIFCFFEELPVVSIGKVCIISLASLAIADSP